MKPLENTSQDENELIMKFTVELGPSVELVNDSPIEIRFQQRAKLAKGFLKKIFEHFAEEATEMRKIGSPKTLKKLKSWETARMFTCAYYGHGSCEYDTNMCKVCCWEGNDPEPFCYCEDC